MSFRRYGGIQYSARHNIVSSNYNTCNYLSVTETVGQPNSYINFDSDISGHIIGPTGSSNDKLWSLNNNIISATGTTNTSGPTVKAYSFNSVSDCTINSMTVGLGRGGITSNTAFGINALKSNTTGYENVGIGYNALSSNTTGKDNIGFGYNALKNNTDGNDNISIGYIALQNTTSGSRNVALGNATLTNNNGNNNVGVGINSLQENSSGGDNVGVGYYSLRFNTTGSNNVGVGGLAANTLISGSNNICIGYDAQPSTTTISNEITLGNSSITSLRCQVTTITGLSDSRDKKDIVPLSNGLTFVDKLNPVSFKWNMRTGEKVDVPDIGFIAQELKSVQQETNITIPNLVYDVNPDRLEASYGTLIPILVSAIKELSAKVKALEERI
jgi:hypothetical protein